MRLNTNPWSASACTGEEAPSGIVASVWSCANTVKLPAALKVTEKVSVPAWSCAGAGSVALASELSTWIALVTVATVFQPESQARTVTVKGTPTVCGLGDPLFPLELPGAADSPGSSTCRRLYGPAAAGAASAATSASDQAKR